MFGSKDIFTGDISLRGLDTNNEMTKTVKFDCDGKKISCDCTVRVKEAVSGKEMEQTERTK